MEKATFQYMLNAVCSLHKISRNKPIKHPALKYVAQHSHMCHVTDSPACIKTHGFDTTLLTQSSSFLSLYEAKALAPCPGVCFDHLYFAKQVASSLPMALSALLLEAYYGECIQYCVMCLL